MFTFAVTHGMTAFSGKGCTAVRRNVRDTLIEQSAGILFYIQEEHMAQNVWPFFCNSKEYNSQWTKLW